MAENKTDMGRESPVVSESASSTPKSVLKAFLPVIVILMVAVGALTVLKSKVGPSQTGKHAEPLREGGLAPEFELDKLGGGSVKFSELKGKVFLLNFWATWCESCLVEMPSIVKLWKSLSSKGFEVVAINVDEKPDRVVPPMAEKLGMTFPLYVDTGTRLSELFDVHAIPLTVILDKNRKILLIESGERDWNSSLVREQVERWLSEK